MAQTMFLTNDALTRKRWAKDLFKVVLPAVEFNYLIGTGTDAIVQMKTELGKGEGDLVRFGIRLPLTGEGVVGRDTVSGNEEALNFRDFSMTIEELNHAVDTGGKMDEQRIPYDLMSEGKAALQEWWSQKLSDYLINTLCGNSSYKIAGKTFAQACTEPDSAHFVKANDVVEASMTSDDVLDLSMLDKAKQKAELMNKDGGFKIRPIMKNGKPYYRVLLHNYVFDALRQNTNVAQWGDLLRAAGKLQMEQVEIEYNGLLISKSERLPQMRAISGNAGIYRGVLLGAQAACFAWGGAGESKSSTMAFVPYTRDAERFVMIRGGGILGCKKVVFNELDYGCITLSSFGAPLD